MEATTVASLRRRLARRSLKPQLNQIRTWVRQGRTDAWIAHQLDVSVGDIRAFKREHELAPADAGEGEAFVPGAEADEPDLRAEDDALVAERARGRAPGEEDEPEEDDTATRRTATTLRTTRRDGDDKPKRRRRGRRGRGGGRGARAPSRRRSRARSTTARRATGSGSTRPAGRPHLRGALGRPPARDRLDRARPDRDQPRRAKDGDEGDDDDCRTACDSGRARTRSRTPSTSGAKASAGSRARPSPPRPTSTGRPTRSWRQLRRRLGSSFIVDELAELYAPRHRLGARAGPPATRPGRTPQSVVDAAFARYVREAKDFAGGRPRETHEKPE